MPISATGPTPLPDKQPTTSTPATDSPTQDASSQVFKSLQPVPSYPSLKGRVKSGVPSTEQEVQPAKMPVENTTETAAQQTQTVKEQAQSKTTTDKK